MQQACKLRDALETGEERTCEAVGDLQTHAQQCREDEEQGHLAALEQLEGIQAQALSKRHFAFLLHQLALRQREAVQEEQHAQQTRYQELIVGVLELMRIMAQGMTKPCLIDESAVDKPHGGNEAHGAQHTDGREVLDGIHVVILQYREGNGVGQRNGWHVEGHTQCIECDEQRLVDNLIAVSYLVAHPEAGNHEATSQQMAEA